MTDPAQRRDDDCDDRSHRANARGFTLVEVLVALTLVVLIATGIAEVFAVATRTTREARDQTSATILAAQKIEVLRGAGAGTRGAPGGSLLESLEGYVDFVDGRGQQLGAGTAAPAGAVYVRRWRIASVSAGLSGSAVIEVRVASVAQEARRGGRSDAPGGYPGEAVLLTVAGTR